MTLLHVRQEDSTHIAATLRRESHVSVNCAAAASEDGSPDCGAEDGTHRAQNLSDAR
jgi:hypothetical protein